MCEIVTVRNVTIQERALNERPFQKIRGEVRTKDCNERPHAIAYHHSHQWRSAPSCACGCDKLAEGEDEKDGLKAEWGCTVA
jgi:hypothetical protein